MNISDKSRTKLLTVGIILVIIILGTWLFLNYNDLLNKNQIILGPEDNGETFNLNEGTEVIVNLPENPTTGYEWGIVEGMDSLNLLENKYISPENQELGKGGIRRVKFTIENSERFTMHYKRSWENQVENIFTIDFQL